MKHIINIEQWERRSHYEFFRPFLNPCVTVSVMIDCTALRESSQSRGFPISRGLMYAVLMAANRVEEFKYRQQGDTVIRHDSLNLNTPIRKADGNFTGIILPFEPDFDRFIARSTPIVDTARNGTSPAYGEDNNLRDVVLLSITPWLRFTSVQTAISANPHENIPIVTIGKIEQNGAGRWDAPMSISAHHGFVDGFHVSRFVDELQHAIDTL